MKKLKMKPNDTDGILITFCGLDGCGKTTMISKLVSELEKEYALTLTKQPTDFVRKASVFRTYMDSSCHDSYDYRSLSLLAASDRIQHVSKFIYPELCQGKIVVSDRYFYSCLANLRGRGYERDKWIYEIAERVIRPDAAFFLDTSVTKAVSCVRSRNEEKDRYIDMALQYKLRKEYISICRSNGGILISPEQTIEQTYKCIIEHVRKVLEKKNERLFRNKRNAD